MSASERGLGRDELLYGDPTFLEAVRWATFAGKLSPRLSQARLWNEQLADDPAGGPEMIAKRQAAREQLAAIEAVLFPEDSDGG